jgi:hypothetical protein
MKDPKVASAAVEVKPSEPTEKIKRADGTMVERPSKEYEQKYPPIYVTNPKDPNIGYFNEAGNQYLLKEIVEREVIKPITSGVKRAENVAFPTSEEKLKPMTRTPIIKEALKKIVNPDFRDTDYTEKHNSVVDALGNPKYKYYNKDKVIGEKEYKKLKANEQSK